MKKAVTLFSQLTDAKDEDVHLMVNAEALKKRVREIIAHQKSTFLSSSLSSSSFSPSESSSIFSSSPNSSSSLLDLMRTGGASLGRLFDTEELRDSYSGSPITETTKLFWGSDVDDDDDDDDDEDGCCFDTAPWAPVKPFRIATEYFGFDDSPVEFPLEYELKGNRSGSVVFRLFSRRNATRKRLFKTLRRFGMWRRKGGLLRLRFQLRLRRLKIIICGTKLFNLDLMRKLRSRAHAFDLRSHQNRLPSPVRLTNLLPDIS